MRKMILAAVGVIAMAASIGVPDASAATVGIPVRGIAHEQVLWIRSSPSAMARKVGLVPHGARVQRLGCSDAGRQRWCRIRYHGTRGWVPAIHLGRKPAKLAANEAL